MIFYERLKYILLVSEMLYGLINKGEIRMRAAT